MRNKFPRELKLGFFLLSCYLFWAIGWIFYSYLIKGSIYHPYRPVLNMELELAKPLTKGLLLGADVMGRSIFEMLSAGLAYSLGLSVAVTLITSAVGLVLGYMAVTAGSFVKYLFDLVINIVFIFPGILIAIMVMAVSGQSVAGLIFALTLTGWTGYAKIARGESKRILGLNYIEAAKALGMGERRLFFKIILPAIFPVMMVNMVLGMSGVIISEAALGFLGLGASPYSWGAMLSNAKTVLLEAPHVAIVLSLVLAGLVIGLNLVGDGLRDYLDPKMR